MLNIGILGCAEIAQRMLMPAVQSSEHISCKVVGEMYNPERLELFKELFNVDGCGDFHEIIASPEVDAVYVPQPPALHFEWAQKALQQGKHCFLEKPSTISYEQTKKLVELAKSKKLALQENYMFQYHSQLAEIRKMLAEGVVGDIRLIKASFGFPLRAANDFRYNKALGGGVLLDAAGYVTKLATILLGDTIKVDTAKLSYMDGYEVDMYGSATFSNDEGVVCQGSFSMDCFYQCSLEVWGNKGKLFTNRIFTAPPGFEPIVIIEDAEGKREIKLDADQHFANSIEMFYQAIHNDELREDMYQKLLIQADLIQRIRELGA